MNLKLKETKPEITNIAYMEQQGSDIAICVENKHKKIKIVVAWLSQEGTLKINYKRETELNSLEFQTENHSVKII